MSKSSKNPLYSFKSELIFVPSENALAFEIKRPYVWSQTHLRFNKNVLAFQLKRPCVFFQAQRRFSVCIFGHKKTGETSLKMFLLPSMKNDELLLIDVG